MREQPAQAPARTAEAPEDQDQTLQVVLDSTSDAVIITDREGRFRIANSAACRMTGRDLVNLDREQWQSIYEVFLPDQTTPCPNERLPLWRAIAGEDVSDTELFVKTLAHPEGIWVSISVSPLRDEARTVVGGVIIVRDSTQRKLAEHALRESEARLRAIVETASDAILTMGETAVIESCNAAAEAMFGCPVHAMIGRPLDTFIPSLDFPGVRREGGGWSRTGRTAIDVARHEWTARRCDGSTFPIDLAISQFRHGTSRLFTAIIRDISERRAFEEKLLSIAEEEQRRIGQDLHDDIGQELTGLTLKAETLADLVRDVQADDRGLARGIVEALDRTREKLRLLARGLVPVEVHSTGLPAALEDLVSRLSELHRVTCTLDCPGPADVTDSRVATHLFHIAQEAVANAVNHGQARVIRVSLESRGRTTRLQVQDDGKGFSSAPAAARGIGIQIMSYRANLIGGKLTIKAARPRGTTVACVLSRTADRSAPRGRKPGGLDDVSDGQQGFDRR